MGAVSLHAQMEYPPHNGSGLLVDQPVVLVLRVLPVAVDGVVGGGLASVAPRLIRRTLFPAAIPQKPFIYDIKERHKFSRTAVCAVHTVADGNETDALLAKQNLGIKSSLEIVASDPAHVLGNDTADLPSLNVGNQPLPIRALKIAPGPSVVRVVDTIRKAALGRIALQQHFLIHNTVTVPCGLIVAAKSLV